MQTQKVNDVVVEPVAVPQVGAGFVGSELFTKPYQNVGFFASTGRGKSTVVRTATLECVGKKTMVSFFASTVGLDPTYKTLLDELKEMDIPTVVYSGLGLDGNDDENGSGDDEKIAAPKKKGKAKTTHLDDVLREIKRQNKKPPPTHPKITQPDSDDESDDDDEDAPKYIFIFDDLSQEELRHPSIYNFLKKSRHYKMKVFISSQDVKDVQPKAMRQMSTVILFDGIDMKRLEHVHHVMGFAVPFVQFLKMYKQATAKKFHFFYASLPDDFRIDFNEKFVS